MVILGLDPGTATTGYGIVRLVGKVATAVDFGLIETPKNGDPGKRLIEIYEQTSLIIKKFSPSVIAVEKLFFATNAKTAMRVSQAVGVILYTAAKSNTKVFEYAPGSIKKMVAGNGRADKNDVQKAVRKILGAGVRSRVRQKTHFDNAADGLAVALCHIYSEGLGKKRFGGDRK